MELLATAADMEEILKVEQRLAQVRTELEEAKLQLQMYDDLIEYGTVYLSLTEILESEEPRQEESLWDRICAGFMNSLEDLGNLVVLLGVILPYVLVLAVAALVVFLIRRKRKK